MVEPEKPFACMLPECGMTFTNEDHLNVHSKKHDMVLQLGMEQKAAFVADQTPTPTRFIRNCEEVGLFQDLQNVTVNPFDEGFKRAIENKQGILSLESAIATSTPDDVLHTPQLLYSLDDPSMLHGQRSAISRSSSDESAEKHYETLSKLTTHKHNDINKPTEVSKTPVIQPLNNENNKKDKYEVPIEGTIVGNMKPTSGAKDVVLSENNKFLVPNSVPLISQKSLDMVVDSLASETKAQDDITSGKGKKRGRSPRVLKKATDKIVPKILPKKTDKVDDYEVFIKLPSGKEVRMKPVDEEKQTNAKEILRGNILKKLPKKAHKKVAKTPKVVNIPSGTLIPVTLVNQAGTPLSNDDLSKVPITKIDDVTTLTKINDPSVKTIVQAKVSDSNTNVGQNPAIISALVPANIIPPKISNITTNSAVNDCQSKNAVAATPIFRKLKVLPANSPIVTKVSKLGGKVAVAKVVQKGKQTIISLPTSKSVEDDPEAAKKAKYDQEMKKAATAASKRYRERLKMQMQQQAEDNKKLTSANKKLVAENALLKVIITEHLKRCPMADDLRAQQEKLQVHDT